MTWKILLVLFVFAIFWGGGFMMQSAQGSSRRDDYHLSSRSRWVRLLGFSSSTGRVYIRYAFLQIIGLLYLIIGLSVAWCCDRELFDDVTAWVFLTFFAGTLAFGLYDLLGKK
jgi:hypothetical protein